MLPDILTYSRHFAALVVKVVHVALLQDLLHPLASPLWLLQEPTQ